MQNQNQYPNNYEDQPLKYPKEQRSYHTSQEHYQEQRPQQNAGFLGGFGQGSGDEWTLVDKADSQIRRNFIKKVYCILAAQLLITVLLIVIAFFSESYREFQRNNLWLFYVCIAVSIITIYALACFAKLARTVPINYILLALFTFTEAYMISIICSYYDKETVMYAGGLTAAAVVGLTFYAFWTKTDFTYLGGFLFAFVMVLIVGSILAALIRNRWLSLVISILGVLLFSIYLIYDTQLIIGKNERKFSIDDYIMAAMNLYLDIINIFLYVLQILGNSSN